MTVRDLIKALEQVDPEREVKCELYDPFPPRMSSMRIGAPAREFRLEDWDSYYEGQPTTKLLVLVAS